MTQPSIIVLNTGAPHQAAQPAVEQKPHRTFLQKFTVMGQDSVQLGQTATSKQLAGGLTLLGAYVLKPKDAQKIATLLKGRFPNFFKSVTGSKIRSSLAISGLITLAAGVINSLQAVKKAATEKS